MKAHNFIPRHIGPSEEEQKQMLATCGVNSIEELIDRAIPDNIRLDEELDLPAGMSEYEYSAHINRLEKKNKLFKSYIGMGYYPAIMPAVIQRNILENPGWYTAYTPYQAEISQGRLEALLNYQTMINDLTGMEMTNASLLDEATAAAEAMLMLYHTRSREQKKNNVNKFFVSDTLFPQTIDLLVTRSAPQGIELITGNHEEFEPTGDFFGAIVQYPAADGQIYDFKGFAQKLNDAGIRLVVAADLLSLSILTPPGEWGADVVVGSTQRFGLPMGYGGPHSGYFSSKESYKRSIPGRIIGVTQDADGQPALRMALQTREQHIKREKATSNICTSQVLLAVLSGMYGVYHGAEGLKEIARHIHRHTLLLDDGLKELGFEQENTLYFDTLRIKTDKVEKIKALAEKKQINFYYPDAQHVGISVHERVNRNDIDEILHLFAKVAGKDSIKTGSLPAEDRLPQAFVRQSEFMTHEVFNRYRSETEMMRYIKSLENKDISLNHSMISLGSCTMKLNSATSMLPLSREYWGDIHPFVPLEQAEGYRQMLGELEQVLNEITGFAATTLQPNSGAQGEYTGLLVIRAYHSDRGESHRNIMLIPASAHGTNPASAVMAGFKVLIVKTNEKGEIDTDDLHTKASENAENLAGLMVTYPSTHGVFEKSIVEITETIHRYGGMVYMDGANMNAQVGLTSPVRIGADICHLNLHKTFGIPHGGGGPGVGPVCCTAELAPYLPGHSMVDIKREKSISAVSASPWGSAMVCLISYAYIKMLGKEGLKKSTQIAILNANYLKSRLQEEYQILYTGETGFVAHEMILDFHPYKKKGVEVIDIAKRLMDYGYHAPTVAFPVHDTLMVEPTESESKAELDRFVSVLFAIKKEIDNHAFTDQNSLLKNAPHTAKMLTQEEWNYPYSRQEAGYPLPYLYERKFWPPVRRVNDAYGDRHLVCTCPPMEAYQDE